MHSTGLDGWVTLLRQPFETEDHLIETERRRMHQLGMEQLHRMEVQGVDVHTLQLDLRCGFVYHPPEEGDERLWAIEYFKERMVELVDEDTLCIRLLEHQAMLSTAYSSGQTFSSNRHTASSQNVSEHQEIAFSTDLGKGRKAHSIADHGMFNQGIKHYRSPEERAARILDAVSSELRAPAEARLNTARQHRPLLFASSASPFGEAEIDTSAESLLPAQSSLHVDVGLESQGSESCKSLSPQSTASQADMPVEISFSSSTASSRAVHGPSAELSDDDATTLASSPDRILPDVYLASRMERVAALERAGLWRLAQEEMAAAMVVCKQHHDNQIRLGAGRLIARLLAEAIRRYAARRRSSSEELDSDAAGDASDCPQPIPPRVDICLGLPRFAGDECLVCLQVQPQFASRLTTEEDSILTATEELTQHDSRPLSAPADATLLPAAPILDVSAPVDDACGSLPSPLAINESESALKHARGERGDDASDFSAGEGSAAEEMSSGVSANAHCPLPGGASTHMLSSLYLTNGNTTVDGMSSDTQWSGSNVSATQDAHVEGLSMANVENGGEPTFDPRLQDAKRHQPLGACEVGQNG